MADVVAVVIFFARIGFITIGVLFLTSVIIILRLLLGKAKKTEKILLPLFSLIIGGLVLWLPSILDSAVNELHRSLFVVDMHSDTLLWARRDLLSEHNFGHVDLPRLIKGNVALQVFTIPTRIPSKLDFNANSAPDIFRDSITIKAIVEGWSLDSVASLTGRTLYLASRLVNAAHDSNGILHLLRFKKDLQQFIKARENKSNITASLLGIEGAHALDDKLENVDVLFDAGIRMMGLTHFFDNALGGSAHGEVKGGITDFGKQVLKRMNEIGIIVDIAHSSNNLIDDIIKYSTRPIVSSHTGVSGVCEGPRNLNDNQLTAVAKSGGLISITYFRPALCGDNLLQSLLDTIKYVKNLVGVQYVALGSDFDGAVFTPFDTTGLIHITNGLLKEGFSKEEIAMVMGENAKRFWLANLPDE
eukprot:TRINITY_DN8007_c0_g1_i1.p1 TRINITY_DN8007_c0_g1~~TRINITY_DN8007_c0_g1_i1.p1  ORF type:complete len:434 (-),score=61.79 TRINITY_DN8007_c0_g1_i1:31-1278(-)